MEHGFNGAKVALCEALVKHLVVHVVGDLQISQIAKFVTIAQVVHGDDVADAPRIQPLDDVAANEASSACDNDFHAHNS